MKKGLACLGLMMELAMPAQAWRPTGWVYFNWPYAYEHGSGDWYYFSPNNVQWSLRHGSAEGWLRLNNSALAHGWSWHTWPYVYSHANTSWYNFAAPKNHRCVNLTTGTWSLFGIAPTPVAGMTTVPGGTNAGVDPEIGAYSLTSPPFYMDKDEVWKGRWDDVQGWGLGNGYSDLPSGDGKDILHPVCDVSWYDCVKWCNAMSEWEGLEPVYYTDAAYTQVYRTGETLDPHVKPTANGRRLPTSLQWEYAARGGVTSRRFPWGSDTIRHAWANYSSDAAYAYDDSPTRGVHPVYGVDLEPHTAPMGALAANGYGLFHMAGNVWEWCFDWHPGAWNTHRSLRGGSYRSKANSCLVGANTAYAPNIRNNSIGFRTVLHAEGVNYP